MKRKLSEAVLPGHPWEWGAPRLLPYCRFVRMALVVLWAFSARGQDGTLRITYDLVLDQSPPLQCQASLASGQGYSIFHWNNTAGGSEITTDDFGAMRVVVRDTDPVGTVNFVDSRADSLYTRGTAFNSPYLLAEPLPEIGWKLEAETRQLGGLAVYKAQARFRGRNYTAWYCPDIPVPVGPWKLHGLPGAILEAYDDESFFHAVFTALKRSPEPFVPDPGLFRTGEVIDLAGFRAMQQNMAGELIRKIRSKLPRGAHLSVEETSAGFLEREFGGE